MAPSLQLPAMHELPSLTTQLITPALARAFDIPQERPGSAAMASAFQAGRLGQQGLDFLMQYNQGLQSQQQQQQQQGAGAQMPQQAAQMAQLQGPGGFGGGSMNGDMQNRQGFGQQQYSGYPCGGQDYYNPAYMMGQQLQQNGSGAAPYPLFQQPNMFGFDAREAMAAGYNLGHFQGKNTLTKARATATRVSAPCALAHAETALTDSAQQAWRFLACLRHECTHAGSLQQQQQHAQQKEQQQRDAQVQQDQQHEAPLGSSAQPTAKRAQPDTLAGDSLNLRTTWCQSAILDLALWLAWDARAEAL